MIRALVLEPTGAHKVVEFPRESFKQAFREHCEVTTFDCVSLSRDLDMWVDDEGLMRQNPVWNPFATALRTTFWTRRDDLDQERVGVYPPLAGTVMLTGGPTPTGDTGTLKRSVLGRLNDILIAFDELGDLYKT